MEKNKIYLGDAYELIKKIPDKSVDLIYTDPPYEFGTFGERNPMVLETTKKAVKKLSGGVDYSILDEYVRVLKYIHIYIWCNDRQIMDYMNFFVNEKGCDYKILGWVKSNPMPMFNKRLLDDVEYLLLFVEKGERIFKGKDTFKNSFKFYQEPINLKDKLLYDHPTIKPYEAVKGHLEKTLSDGVVLDPFIGSGTTAVACKELGLNYIGFEIDKSYYDIAQDRLNGITQVERREEELGIMNIFDFMEEK